jgi:hypothetical protein
MTKTFANGRTIVHKGDGKTNISAAPDVCKTPSPGGPVPVPYVNLAKDSDLSEGSTTVEIEGHPVALKSSALGTSTGDEAGTAGGGLISSKTKGKMTWGTYSLDVKFEGKGVVRFMDVTQHNGNTFNTAFLQEGGTGWAYGDDPVGESNECPRSCGKDKASHRILETPMSQGLAMQLLGTLDQISANPKMSNLKVFKLRGGYMIGVLLCRCQQKIYATMSGEEEPLDGFKRAIDLLNEKDEKKRWSMCGLVDFSKVRDTTDEIPGGQQFFLEELDAPATPPGLCAGPKLIQKAHQDGHKPGSMSEVFYFPPGAVTRVQKRSKNRPVNTSVEVTYMETLQGNTSEVTKQFHHGDAVPSCATCQIHLTPMLCPTDNPCKS